MELEETAIWQAEQEGESTFGEEEADLTSLPMKTTGDPVVDLLEAQLAAGEEISWDLL